MTLSAQRSGDIIEVTTTYGPIINKVSENYQHVKHFNQQLSSLIEEIESERIVTFNGWNLI